MNQSIRDSRRCWLRSGALLVGLCLLPWSGAQGQQFTQTITLKPGWNAVWLEVDPTNRAPASVFGGLPLASVWTWSERVTATDFIQNPATAGWNKNQWLAWFPTNSPEAPLVNLYAILPARSYVIKLNGTDPVTFQVSGTVVPQPTTWSPNLYNLRGFPVHPSTPATFREYFQYSSAFWDSSDDVPRGIYRLDANGVWSPALPDDTMKRGEAYWVYVNGASDYPAPESWTVSTGDGVYFSPLTYRTTLTLANRTSEPRTMVFSTEALRNKAYQVENPLNMNPLQIRPFLKGYTVQLQAHSSIDVRLYLDRTRRTPGASGVIFSINDQMGTLQYIGVSSDGGGALQPGQADDVGGGPENANEAYPLQGLWIGTVQVKAVGETQSTNAMPPTPVATAYPMRVLIHVDTNGLARLLREVVVASTPSSSYVTNITTLTNGVNQPVTISSNVFVPGTTTLLTDTNVINQYQIRYRNSTAVTVRRFTTVQFDDAANPSGTPMVGSFLTNSVVNATLSIPSGYATNPYYHRYHPDHNNLDPTRQFYVQEDFAIRRQVQFDFTPIGSNVPSYGVDGLDGIYRETVTGLHKVPLLASGTFTLQRISTIGVLNPPLQ
jgi:hypothetical protein